MLSLVSASDAVMLGRLTQDKVLNTYGGTYLQVVSLSYLLAGISQIFLCILKNSGRALRSSIISSVSVIVNIVLNTALIFGLFGFLRMEIADALDGGKFRGTCRRKR
ncbi:hypothetical protein D7V86_13150 [bacterium D16-51]|nr:hypothetical protein D7V96_17320 [bacterium D16-59]RKI59337.1 hypothetical protein D7V86_13150 [bacterium D16-51]